MIGETVLVLVLLVAVRTDGHGNADMFTEVRSHSIILEKIVIIGSPTSPPHHFLWKVWICDSSGDFF